MNIIELAKQAGLGESYISKTRKESGIVIKNIDCLEAFANLVAAAARADEREECVKQVQEYNTAMTDMIAAEIRARGNT